MSKNAQNLIWIDLEMTGLSPNIHKIIEIATLITDQNLNILSNGPVIPIYQNNHQLKLMDSWNNNVHTKNGLIAQIKKSSYNENSAEKQTISFLKQWTLQNTSPMCGNSINLDRQFLLKYMPTLEKHFHYRQIDVSTIKELALRWKPNICSKLKKNNKHRASNDLYESVQELLFYRKNFFQI